MVGMAQSSDEQGLGAITLGDGQGGEQPGAERRVVPPGAGQE